MWTTLASLLTIIKLSIAPYSCFEPCMLKATIKLVEPEKVAEICIEFNEAGSDLGALRSSCWPPLYKTNETRISNLLAGEYKVRASAKLAGTGIVVKTAEQTLTVLEQDR